MDPRLKETIHNTSGYDQVKDFQATDETMKNLLNIDRQQLIGQVESYISKLETGLGGENFNFKRNEVDTWSSEVIARAYGGLVGIFKKSGNFDFRSSVPANQDHMGDFFDSYTVNLHEIAHAIDYLNLFKEKSGTPYEDLTYALQKHDEIGRLATETAANEFALSNSLIPRNFVQRAVARSQSSYLMARLKNIAAMKHRSGDIPPQDPINPGFKLKDLSILDVHRSNEIIQGKSHIDFAEKMAYEHLPALMPTMNGLRMTYLYNVIAQNDQIKDYFDNYFVKPIKFAKGGYVTGEGGPTDDKIPALLSNKEFVVNASATSKFRPILEAINSGMFQGFRGGTSKTVPKVLSPAEQRQIADNDQQIGFYTAVVASFDKEIKELNKDLREAAFGSLEYREVENQLQIVQARKTETVQRINILEEANNKVRSQTVKVLDKVKQAAEASNRALIKSGNDAANNFKDSFEYGLNEAFKTGDFKAFGDYLLDSFTKEVISSFSKGFTDMIFDDLIGETDKKGNVKTPKILDKIFGGQEELGKTGKVSDTMKTSTSEFMDMFKKIPQIFSGIFDGLVTNLGSIFQGIGGLFSGGSGGTNPFTFITSFFGGGGKNQGGIVPSTPYSQVGKDSVPTMLTPGEMIIPANKVRSMNKENSNTNQTVVNLSITGDVSRQTRQEIVKMLPTIASGVNAQNKERNYKYG